MHKGVYLDHLTCYNSSNEISGKSVMARYMWCANHLFTSIEDLKKHLGRDEKVFTSILPELKGSGLAESKRGIMTEAKGKYCLLYTSPSPRDRTRSRMPSSA